ncbi:propionyl-CoA synthetase [Hoeflea sp. CAU 1731]
MSIYRQVYSTWKADPAAFWEEVAKGIDWIKTADRVFNPDSGIYGRWFDGASCNTCWNCVDRHVKAGNGNRVAIVYDSPVTGEVNSLTYAELLEHVNALAHVLRGMGVERGDRVIIYMPMVTEALVAMLATARLGAIHSVVFGGFAAAELATRIVDAEPKVIVSASCGIEPTHLVDYKKLLDEAIEIAGGETPKCLILQRERQRCSLIPLRDFDYLDEVGAALDVKAYVACVPVAATDPLYILYTSGTTGQPKGVVRDNGGHMVALKWSMENHYGVAPGDVFWAASDVGWVVGHSYICYGPLLHGCTTVLYEGKPVGTPDAGAFWRVIADHRVNALFTAPTAFRAIRKQDPDGKLIGSHDLSTFRALFLAGERSDASTIRWAEEKLGCPVIDHWWQTETGWAMSGNPVGLGALPVKYGSPGLPMPGYDIQVLDDDGRTVPPGDLGNIVVKLPLPPSGTPTLWNAEARFRKAYLEEFPGYYATSDAGFMDEDGYIFIMARTDDVINVAGHRLSTGQMEEIITAHPDIAEAAVVGRADETKGQLPLGFYVMNDNATSDPEEIERELVKSVRETIGAVASFRTVVPVSRLPKTRSGKILRATMQKIAEDADYKLPAAIEDPAVLDEIKTALKARGLLQSKV